MYDHIFYKQVQISRSDIRPHIKWAVSLVMLHMVTSIFLQGLCGYIWVNTLTLSPQRGIFYLEKARLIVQWHRFQQRSICAIWASRECLSKCKSSNHTNGLSWALSRTKASSRNRILPAELDFQGVNSKIEDRTSDCCPHSKWSLKITCPLTHHNLISHAGICMCCSISTF